MKSYFSFDYRESSSIRKGIITTPHGIIDTPCFVPVATNGAIKGCDSFIIEDLGTDLLFCNTYHLMIHPGTQTIKNAGGIHAFMRRTRPIITDSGGFQIFSLMYGGVAQELKSQGTKKHENTVLKVSEEGVTFRSYRTGEHIYLTPEISVQQQKNIGADIIIPLDELLPFHSENDRFLLSFYRTHRWMIRSFEEHSKNKNNQAMYAVVHGGLSPEHRKKSCEILSQYDFDGFAIGGSLGKNTQDVIDVLKMTIPYLDPCKPKHLLGIADIKTIIEALKYGIDTFDSAYPTKCARHGTLFSDEGPIKIMQSRWKEYHKPISQAPLVREYTAAYIHHLFKSHEQLAGILASLHNIYYLNQLCKKIRNGEYYKK
jgi:queuine tRNA-ribosyltransferase